MMIMNELFKFKEIGILKVDKIFFESYYPILFTCKNEKNHIFICVCCQADSKIKKWLVTDILPETVIDLLSNKITIRDSFLKDSIGKYTIIYDNNKEDYEIEENNATDWDGENNFDLPTPGEYMDAEEDEFTEEIEYFKNIDINYNSYRNSEIIKGEKKIISYEEDNHIIYSDKKCDFNIKYSIGVLKNPANNKLFKVMSSIYKDKMIIDDTDDHFRIYKHNIYTSNIGLDNSLSDLNNEKEICSYKKEAC